MLMPSIKMIRWCKCLILILVVDNGVNFGTGSELNRINNSRNKHDGEEYGDNNDIDFLVALWFRRLLFRL